MNKTCATCHWFNPDTLLCERDDSGVYMTGPRGRCPYWEGGDDLEDE